MRSRKGCLLTASVLALILLVGICAGVLLWRTSATGSERPLLRVLQPAPNASLTSHVTVPVQAGAEGRRSPIRWLRFYVDDRLAGEQMGPQAQLIGTWDWTPQTPGQHTLAFVAANEQGTTNMVTLSVTVLASADRDADGLPDAQDACPDQPAPANQGCPIPNDADNDGLSDDQDACPQAAGAAEERGCPPESLPDQDGDGVADWEDHCPSQAGGPEWNGCPQQGLVTDRDADGLVDAADACPDQAGPPENGGCPLQQADDRDGDGIADAQDACPDQGGSPQNNGCPVTDDRDQDGIPDAQDGCPDLPGWPQFNGCLPEGWIFDSDRDGVPDFLDRCDDQRGSILRWGCPRSGDADDDGIPDGEDNCPEREGPRGNGGCPHASLLIPMERPNICTLVPEICTYGDIEQSGRVDLCPEDTDCDGVVDGLDLCPNRFGTLTDPNLRGCPPDWNGNGRADESDDDGDGIPNPMDSCPQDRGAMDNSGCPWPAGESLELTIELRGFVPLNAVFENFYCYASLQDSGWVRLPQSGSLTRSGQAYIVEEQVGITVRGDQPLHLETSCEGQTDSTSDVQDLGRLERFHEARYWHCNWIDSWSETGSFMAEYRICVER